MKRSTPSPRSWAKGTPPPSGARALGGLGVPQSHLSSLPSKAKMEDLQTSPPLSFSGGPTNGKDPSGEDAKQKIDAWTPRPKGPKGPSLTSEVWCAPSRFPGSRSMVASKSRTRRSEKIRVPQLRLRTPGPPVERIEEVGTNFFSFLSILVGSRTLPQKWVLGDLAR